MSRQSELAQIHIAKKQLGLDDDTYRIMLHNLTGKDSTKKMTINERYKVLAHLKEKGFKPKKNGKRYSPKSSHKKPGEKTIIDKIRAVWIDMGKMGYISDNSETALDKWVARMTAKENNGKGINSVAWLKNASAQKVLEALKSGRLEWKKKPAETENNG